MLLSELTGWRASTARTTAPGTAARILKKKPQEVAAGAGRNAQAIRRLAVVNRLLIRGHIEKELRTVRYLDRMRRGTQRLRFHATAPTLADPSSGRSAER